VTSSLLRHRNTSRK